MNNTKYPYLIRFIEYTDEMEKSIVKTNTRQKFKGNYTVHSFYKPISRLL